MELLVQLLLTVLGIALYNGLRYLYKRRKENKPKKFRLDNHNYLGQQLDLNGEILKVIDFDNEGNFVRVYRESDRTYFVITKKIP